MDTVVADSPHSFATSRMVTVVLVLALDCVTAFFLFAMCTDSMLPPRAELIPFVDNLAHHNRFGRWLW